MRRNSHHRVFPWLSTLIGLWAFVVGSTVAEEPQPTPSDPQFDDAMARGLTIVQKAAENYPNHRKCFSCHHQTLPLLAMREAEAAGLAIDVKVAEGIEKHSFESFHSRLNKLREGGRIGGRANTVSYGLWTLDLAGHEADETTTAMVEFLLKNQEEDGRWRPPSHRPPLEESRVAVTVLSAYYMQRFAQERQHEEAEKAIAKARSWLAAAPLKSQEDYNFRLWGLVLLEDSEQADARNEVARLREKILLLQREDGGWGQLPDMDSDGYATGQTLYVLAQAGVGSGEALRKASEFLLRTQQDDGSWRVETRSKPVQVFFDNGDPHGKSQFISIAATGWAVAALANSKRLGSEKTSAERPK